MRLYLKNEGLQKRLNQVSKAAQGYWDRKKAQVVISGAQEDACLDRGHTNFKHPSEDAQKQVGCSKVQIINSFTDSNS